VGGGAGNEHFGATLEQPVNIKIPPARKTASACACGVAAWARKGARRLFVVAQIRMPDKIGDEEKRLWEQLARQSRFRPRE